MSNHEDLKEDEIPIARSTMSEEEILRDGASFFNRRGINRWDWSETRDKIYPKQPELVHEVKAHTKVPQKFPWEESARILEDIDELHSVTDEGGAPEAFPYAPPAPKHREPKVDEFGRSYGAGGRKSATANALLSPGTGIIEVNGKPLREYFTSLLDRNAVIQPLFVTERMRSFDVKLMVQGGGRAGQAGAARLAIARALQNNDPNFRPVLKMAGFLTRDAREVERKKTGLRKARKAEQWGKR